MATDRLFAIAGSVVVHLILLGIVLFTMWESPQPPKTTVQKPIIQARAVDEATAMAAVRRREAEEQRKKDLTEQQRQAAAAEKKRQAEVKQQKIAAEKKRQAEEKKAAQEKKRQAELKKKQLEQKQEQARLAEEQRKKDEAEKQRQRDEAEKQRKKAEADRQRREEELKRQMDAEARRLAEEQQAQYSQQLARERDQYSAAIGDAIQRNWQRPPGSSKNFVCKVLVKQIPSGDVVDVRVVESCGTLLLDRSVESAVRKASPLPLPANRELFDRELEIEFIPYDRN